MDRELHRRHRDRHQHLMRRLEEKRGLENTDDIDDEDKALLQVLDSGEHDNLRGTLISLFYALHAETSEQSSPVANAPTTHWNYTERAWLCGNVHVCCSTHKYEHCWELQQGGGWRVMPCEECVLQHDLRNVDPLHAQVQLCTVPDIGTQQWERFKVMLARCEAVKQRREEVLQRLSQVVAAKESATRRDLAVGCVATQGCDCGCAELRHIKENGLDVTARSTDTHEEHIVHIDWDDSVFAVEHKIATAFSFTRAHDATRGIIEDDYDRWVTERPPRFLLPSLCAGLLGSRPPLQELLLRPSERRQICFSIPSYWNLSEEEKHNEVEDAKYRRLYDSQKKGMYRRYLEDDQYAEDYHAKRLPEHERRAISIENGKMWRRQMCPEDYMALEVYGDTIDSAAAEAWHNRHTLRALAECQRTIDSVASTQWHDMYNPHPEEDIMMHMPVGDFDMGCDDGLGGDSSCEEVD